MSPEATDTGRIKNFHKIGVDKLTGNEGATRSMSAREWADFYQILDHQSSAIETFLEAAGRLGFAGVYGANTTPLLRRLPRLTHPPKPQLYSLRTPDLADRAPFRGPWQMLPLSETISDVMTRRAIFHGPSQLRKLQLKGNWTVAVLANEN